jgi:putative membrane protein
MQFNQEITKMKKYLKFSPIMPVTSLFLFCSGCGYCGPQGPRGWGHMMNYGFGYGGGMSMWLLFLIVIGLLVYFIIQNHKTKSWTPTQNESPLDILKKRYAKGEITKEEYESMKKDLGS